VIGTGRNAQRVFAYLNGILNVRTGYLSQTRSILFAFAV
jgi:hypothetical protein